MLRDMLPPNAVVSVNRKEPDMDKLAKMSTLVSRINRQLHKDGSTLRKARAWDHNTGWYYVVDRDMNGIIDTDVDPEQMALDLQLLYPGEPVLAELFEKGD
jgi:hypothetical protein